MGMKAMTIYVLVRGAHVIYSRWRQFTRFRSFGAMHDLFARHSWKMTR